MNADIRNQIESYYSTMIADQRPVSPDEVSARIRTVRPLPGRVDKTPRWVPLAVAASAAVAVIAVLVVPLLTSARDVTPPAVTTTTTISSTTTSVDASNPYGDLAWSRAEFGPLETVVEVGGTYFAIGSPPESADDGGPYFWWSDDGTTWTKDLLPDSFAPAYYWDDQRQLFAVYDPALESVEDPTWMSLNVTRVDGRPRLFLQPSAGEPSFAVVAVLPDMEVDGLVPVAFSQIEYHTADRPVVAQVGDVRVTTGAIRFEMPDEVVAQLPEFDGFSVCCDHADAAGGESIEFTFEGELRFEKVWKVEGQRLSVDVIVYDSDIPRTIHAGHVLLPASIGVFTTTEYSGGGDYAVDVMWRSSDGGQTYKPTQPEPLLAIAGDPRTFPANPRVLTFDDRMLWYLGHWVGGRWGVGVWSSTDGLEWTLEQSNVGFIDSSIMRKERVLVTSRSDGLWGLSVDGVSWGVAPVPNDSLVNVFRDGFVNVRRDGVFLSSDGLSWHRLSVPEGLGSPESWEALFPGSAGYRVTFFGSLVVIDDFDHRETWVAILPQS